MTTEGNTVEPSWLQPHQLRVVDEKLELDVKIAALTKFLAGPVAKTLSETEADHLVRQVRAMGVYTAVLGERIEHWGAPDDKMVIYRRMSEAVAEDPFALHVHDVAVVLSKFDSADAAKLSKGQKLSVMTRAELRAKHPTMKVI